MKGKTKGNLTTSTIQAGLDLTKKVGQQPQTTNYNSETYPTYDAVLNKQKQDIEDLENALIFIIENDKLVYNSAPFSTGGGGYTLRIERDGRFSFDIIWDVSKDSVVSGDLVDRLVTFPDLSAVPYFQKFSRAMFHRIEYCLTTATTNLGLGRKIDFEGLLINDTSVIETIALDGNRAGHKGFRQFNHSLVGNGYTSGDNDSAKLAILPNFEAKLNISGNTATNINESDHIVSIRLTGQLH